MNCFVWSAIFGEKNEFLWEKTRFLFWADQSQSEYIDVKNAVQVKF